MLLLPLMQRILLVIAFLILALSGAAYSLPEQPAYAAKSREFLKSYSYNASSHFLTLSFSNLTSVKNLQYELTYNSNGIFKGVQGSFSPTKRTTTVTRQVFIGSCSTGGTCVSHETLSNGMLRVAVTYTNGQSVTRFYPISF